MVSGGWAVVVKVEEVVGGGIGAPKHIHRTDVGATKPKGVNDTGMVTVAA